MSERIVEEKSDGKLINQLMQLQAGLRIGAARLSAQRTHAPLIWAFLSVWALTFPQTRAQSCAPPCRDEEMRVRRVRPSVLLEERERGRGPVRTATNKKRATKERKKNKQTKAVLFIYFSPLSVFFGFVESRSSRRESGPRLRDFSLCELSRDVREKLRLKPGTGFLDHTDTESVRIWSHNHIIMSTT